MSETDPIDAAYESIKAQIAAEQDEQRRQLDEETASKHTTRAPMPEIPSWFPPPPLMYAKGQLGLQIRRKRIESIVRKNMEELDREIERFPDGEEKAHLIREIRLPFNEVLGSCRRLQRQYPLNKLRDTSLGQNEPE